jgi:predicted outer membrane protein
MMRSMFVAAVLCAACTHHQQVRDLETTTTSATIRGDRGITTLEPDAGIAAAVEAYDDAAVSRATVAIGRAKDSRVRDYARLVRDRHHDAKLATPPTTLGENEDQSQLDFDRAYVAAEVREQSALLQMLDASTPEAKTVELRKRLVDLRPQVADLWVRAFELQQILAAP